MLDALIEAAEARMHVLQTKHAEKAAKEREAVDLARQTGNALYTAGNFWHDRYMVEQRLRAVAHLLADLYETKNAQA